MKIQAVPFSSRPRERLARYGVSQLRDLELMAILIGSGNRGNDVLQLAGSLVRQYKTEDLALLTVKELRKIPGIGSAKACSIAAAFELGRRVNLHQETEIRISEPREAFELVRDLGKARKEHLVALYLDARNCLIHRETVSIGSLNTTRTHPREILHPAIVHLALAFILVHNHPSGDLTPSKDDIEFTRAVGRAADLMGITLYDHLIVSRKGFVSLKEGQWL
ncbi:MAG: DNA repair protein RadC [Acidobacteria bacterium]|nr:DNA repair protein RadC [Acidobacteriota bacterium]